jgi:hypothetical protein
MEQEDTMFKHRFAFCIAASFILGMACVALALDVEQALGTWKQAPSQEMVSAAANAAASIKIAVVDPAQNSFKLTLEAVDSTGSVSRAEFIGKEDGKDYAVTGLPDADTVSLKRSDAYTINCIYKKGGRPVKMERIVLSEDGCQATIFQKGKDASGMDSIVVNVWNKQ